MRWFIHMATQGASEWLMSFRKTFKLSHTFKMCFFSVKLLSVPHPLLLTALIPPRLSQTDTQILQAHIPQTPLPELQHTLKHSQIEDIAMMDTRARGWKLRPDVTSNQGLITAQYISLSVYVCVCVCTFLFLAKMTPLLRNVLNCTHTNYRFPPCSHVTTCAHTNTYTQINTQ